MEDSTDIVYNIYEFSNTDDSVLIVAPSLSIAEELCPINWNNISLVNTDVIVYNP